MACGSISHGTRETTRIWRSTVRNHAKEMELIREDFSAAVDDGQQWHQ